MEAKSFLQQKMLNSKMVFIVASDDHKWCQEMFANQNDVRMTNFDNSAELDLAILSQCDHSIISFGTFGFWTAYLRTKPGKVIVADGYAPEYHILTNHIKSTLPEWTTLDDPCFSKLSNLHNSSSIPELTPECIDKKIEYGIDEISKASKIEYGI